MGNANEWLWSLCRSRGEGKGGLKVVCEGEGEGGKTPESIGLFLASLYVLALFGGCVWERQDSIMFSFS